MLNGTFTRLTPEVFSIFPYTTDQAWLPSFRGMFSKLEGLQRAATKLISGLRQL